MKNNLILGKRAKIQKEAEIKFREEQKLAGNRQKAGKSRRERRRKGIEKELIQIENKVTGKSHLNKNENENEEKNGAGAGAGKVAGKVEFEDIDVQDQGFTRPKVLILVPFKKQAYEAVERILKYLPKRNTTQVQNKARYLEEYSKTQSTSQQISLPTNCLMIPTKHCSIMY